MKLVEFSKVTDILAKEHTVKIKEGRGWAANIEKREVFYVKNDVYNLSEEHILGFLLHETAHIHYTTKTSEPKDNKELFHSALNMLEDISIENIISKDYPNAGEILASTKEEVLDTLVKMLPKMKNASIHEKSLLFAAARFENRGYATGLTQYEIVGNKIAAIMATNKDLILNRKRTEDLLPIVDEIVNLLIKEIGQPTEEEKRNMARGYEASRTGEAQESKKGQIISKLKGGNGWGGEDMPLAGVEFVDKIADQARMIGKQLRSVLKRNNSMEFGGRFRTGKLMAKRFVRVKVMKDRNPFARRIVKSNQSYAFAVASDVSGSMFGYNGKNTPDQASYALSSMFMVGEALQVAGVPRAMVIFGKRAVTSVPMGKNKIRWEDLANDKGVNKAGQSDTRIEAAMESCMKELEKTRSERKIMIILTDGSSSQWAVEQQFNKAQKLGIECLGITIGYGGILGGIFGKDKNVQIDNTRDTSLIGKAFIDILKASIKKSL